MKIIFLDHDGVICLQSEWGSRFTNRSSTCPVDSKFDIFNKKAIDVLNEILKETDAEIVISSDWRFFADLSELKQLYSVRNVTKGPIDTTSIGKYDYEVPEDYPYNRQLQLEQNRSLEILHWLKNHPEVTHWVAIDDLNMGERDGWGLSNFVFTSMPTEGIKQTGIKEKILKFLK